MPGESKILTIRLIGSAGSAVRAFGQTEAAAGTLGARLARVGKSFSSVGGKMSHMGSRMTHSFTLPLAVAAGAAIKMSADFQTSMERIHTQAGGSEKDVRQLTASVMDLAKHAQQGPKELADSLGHLKKVGMSNKQAMDALKQSSDLAAVSGAGLEETTNALAGAWRTGIKGAKHFNTVVSELNAAAGAGNTSVQDLVSAMSTGILPVAKTAGASFQDVAASLALFTDENVPAQRAATRLRSTLIRMVAPSGPAIKALKGIGLTSESLGKTLRKPQGLLKAVQLLHDHLQGMSKVKQEATVADIFGKSKGSAAIMSMLNNLDVLKLKYKQVDKMAGRFGQDVAAQRKTAAAQFALLKSAVERLAIKMGNVLLPVAVMLSHGLNKFLDWIQKLPGPLKSLAGVVAVVVAAAGPLMWILGSVASLIGAVLSPVGAVVAVVVALGVAFVEAYKHSAAFRMGVKEIWEAIKGFVGGLIPTIKKLGQQFVKQVLPGLKKLALMFQTDIEPALVRILHFLEPVAKFLLQMFGGAVIGTIKGFIQAITGVIEVVKGVVNFVDDVIHGRWKQAWHDLVGIFKGVLDLIVGAFKVWWNVGILSIFRHGFVSLLKLLGGSWKGILGFFKGGIRRAGKILHGVERAIWWPFKMAFKLVRAIIRLEIKIIWGILRGLIRIAGKVLGGIVKVVSWPFRKAWDLASGIVSGGIGRVMRFFGSVAHRVGSALSSVAGAVRHAFSGAAGWLWNAGSNIVSGLWRGISAMGGWLVRQLRSWALRVIPGPIARVLGIKSPSRLMATYGRFIGEGLELGIAGMGAKVEAAAAGLAHRVGAGFGVPAIGLAGTMAGAASLDTGPARVRGGSRGTVINVNVAGNVIGEHDFAKRVTPTIRKELISVGRNNGGVIFPR